MNIDEALRLIETGEKIDVEFKKSRTSLTKDVYDSVCSFSNRDGGYIFLGVSDKREILGIEENSIDKILKEFTSTINNGFCIYPPIYLTPEVLEIKPGVKIIAVHVPQGNVVRQHNGTFWDRSYDGDIKITNNEEMMYRLYARKQGEQYVNRVYPKLDMHEVLRNDLFDKVRKMAAGRDKTQDWINMTNEDILRSCGMLLKNSETGEEGITLAAILIFGTDETIFSVLPHYKTDAIYRVKNLDRYDDRDVVITNLIDSYDRLMLFGQKHLNDTFTLDGIISISSRDKILREIISNVLAHRDYSSAFPAKFVIESKKMYTENSSQPHGHGEILLNTFTPYSKNPPIAKLFRIIGYADEMGSGMRNTYKYTKLYSGALPKFEEGDVFTTTIPLDNVAELAVTPNVDKHSSREMLKINETDKKILQLLAANPSVTRVELARELGFSLSTVQRHLTSLKKEEIISRDGGTFGGIWKIVVDSK